MVNPPRRHKYSSGGGQEDIGYVRVIAETAGGHITDVKYYELPLGAQLHLWLQRLRPGGGPVDYEPLPPADSPAQIVFMGHPFRVESADPLQGAAGGGSDHSHKPAHPHRWRYPGAGHFRIGRWRIVNSAGATIREDQGDDNYQLFFAFYHNR